MTTKLTIDEGNSSTKAAIWRNDILLYVRSYPHLDREIVSDLAGDDPVDAIAVCSVCNRSKEEVNAILSPVTQRVVFLDMFTPLPITIDYCSPETLGADRIAAAVGASVYTPREAALIVDIGTAITYDVVQNDCFIGGNIAPGIFMRLEALNHFTKALPLVNIRGDIPEWGYDTETAIRSGALLGVAGEIHYYQHLIGPKSQVFLTGGSANLVLPYLPMPIRFIPDLVHIGLHRILNHNENI